jgi:hypothetical protein
MVPTLLEEIPIAVQSTEAAFFTRKHIIETAAKCWPELKQVETNVILH